MTKMTKGKAAIAAGIGSAAIAAAVMYANHRKDKTNKAQEAPVPPIVDPPETD